ncbi:RNA polymerase sigma factor SigJ [Solicola gregarius]|uniref:RNA polymerase sigma factor SigJ n=1 Tax=Solicola gregarius TaxID=2908642 RepID=A0AA46TKS7_9ACTN|nr:RNA polymerase sigma factor SigJ [Solicola gregarius]UYM06739.1 RNA polymerase sigma factor SigJ [Solicola gregarius]
MEPADDLDPDAATAALTTVTWAAERPRLLTLGYRMLGSWHDAEDIVQDAWLRWAAADRTDIESPTAYLTTMVTRLAIDRLRARQRSLEAYVGPWLPEPVATDRLPDDLAGDADSLSLATLHLMERLTPPERAVYVLREGFAYSFREIGTILDRTEPGVRQLFKRARQRIGDKPRFQADPAEHERLLRAVMDASRAGDVDELERELHDQVVLWSDGGGKAAAALKPIVGPAKVARFLAGVYGRRPAEFELVELNGLPALEITARNGTRIMALDLVDGAVAGVYMVANPDKLAYV